MQNSEQKSVASCPVSFWSEQNYSDWIEFVWSLRMGSESLGRRKRMALYQRRSL